MSAREAQVNTQNPKVLIGALNAIKKDTGGDKVSGGDLIESLKSRSFGPFLTDPAIITILPTGALAGLPFLWTALSG